MKTFLTRRFLPMLLVSLLCVSLMAPAAQAVTQKEINDLHSQASELKNKKADIKKELSKLDASGQDAMQKKNKLDQECNIIEAQIDNNNAQISQYDKLIGEKETEIADLEEQEAAQYELFCKRVRAMEENGTVSYWECIFSATSFSDLLSRLDFVGEIMEGDQRVLDNLRDVRERKQTEKEALEAAKAEKLEKKKELSEQKAELDERRKEAADLMKQINADSDKYEAMLDDLDREEDSIQADIVKKSQELEAQRKREEAEKNKGNGGGSSSGGGSASTGVVTSWMGSGGYMWPEKVSKRITSPYGVRVHPITGKKRKHNGVDIGGVGYTTQVLASKAGTVIVSKNSSSYGNYVVVSHGSGNTTLYAHMSKRLVSVGQTVQQGQVLGITGSTGRSTGPHLHFEITEGGNRVDPLKYLTGYQRSW